MNRNNPQTPKDPKLIDEFASYTRNFQLEDLPVTQIKCNEAVIGDADFFKIDIQKSVFVNSTFHHCCFEKASFMDVVFEGCDLSNSKFTGSYFERCCFISCKCVGTDMSDTILKHITMRQSKLLYANFDRSYLTNVLFEDIDFTEASISEAKLAKFEAVNSRFVKNNFFKTMLSSVDFSNNEFIAPTVSAPPVELKGVIINMSQAAELIRLWGIKVI